MPLSNVNDSRERHAERKAAIAAINAMIAARPLKPPPLPANIPQARRPGELALARAIRSGEYVP
jgi:hypothetical protein